MDTPVLLIGYKRSNNIKKILDLLLKFQIKNIYIYIDGSINNHDFFENSKTKETALAYSKLNKNISILLKEKNIGLKYNIPEAINWVFNFHNKIIILEDDCIPNESFFSFCEELLNKYYSDLRIGQISGSNFLNSRNFKYSNNESYMFSKITNCWGWATWKNRWENIHDIEMDIWPEIKNKKYLEEYFENGKDVRYARKIFNQIYPNKIIWDRAWFLTNIINKRFTIIPRKNLISNIGYDNLASGPNPKKYNSLELQDLKFPLIHPIKVQPNKSVDDFLIKEGFSNPSIKYRIINRLKKNKLFKYLLN